MQSHSLSCLLAFAMAAALLGCRTSAPEDSGAAERQALEQRAWTLRNEAMLGGRPTPASQAEFRQLADDIRAWQQRIGSDDLRVTQQSVTTARRADGDGGGAGCDDCPGYWVHGDNVCFLEQEGECPVDEGDDLTIGRVCVYTCIWIGSRAEPASLNAPGKLDP